MTLITYINQYNAGTPYFHCEMDTDYKVMLLTRQTTGVYLHSKTYTNAGVFSDADTDNTGGYTSAYQIALDKTTTPRLAIAATWDAFGDGFTMHSYDNSGSLTYIDAIGAAVTSPKGVAIDNTLSTSVVFIGQAYNGGTTILSFPYTGAGFGAQIDASPNDSYSASWLSIDTEYKLLFLTASGTGNAALVSWSYDSNGDNLTQKDVANTFNREVNLAGSDLDTTRKLVFDCSDSGLNVYSYDSAGTFSASLSSVTDKDFVTCHVDSAKRVVYATAEGDGVFVYRYAADGTSLTELASDDQGGTYFGCAVDTVNNVLATTVNNNGFYSYLSTVPGITCASYVDSPSQSTVRKFHGKVEVTWTDSFIDNTVAATANDTNRIHDETSLISQTMDGVTEVPRRWAHLDDTIKADGTFYPMPGTTLLAQTNQVGWWGTTECDSNGLWESTTTTTAAP